MSKFIKSGIYAICILLWCVFIACNLPQKEKWDREFMDAVDNQIRCNKPFMDAIEANDLEKARLYCDSIAYFANKVDSLHNLMTQENAP